MVTEVIAVPSVNGPIVAGVMLSAWQTGVSV
jgi:hypothetical protein